MNRCDNLSLLQSDMAVSASEPLCQPCVYHEAFKGESQHHPLVFISGCDRRVWTELPLGGAHPPRFSWPLPFIPGPVRWHAEDVVCVYTKSWREMWGLSGLLMWFLIWSVELQVKRPLMPVQLSPEQVGLEMFCLCGRLDLLIRAQMQQVR